MLENWYKIEKNARVHRISTLQKTKILLLTSSQSKNKEQKRFIKYELDWKI